MIDYDKAHIRGVKQDVGVTNWSISGSWERWHWFIVRVTWRRSESARLRIWTPTVAGESYPVQVMVQGGFLPWKSWGLCIRTPAIDRLKSRDGRKGGLLSSSMGLVCLKAPFPHLPPKKYGWNIKPFQNRKCKAQQSRTDTSKTARHPAIRIRALGCRHKKKKSRLSRSSLLPILWLFLSEIR